MRWPRGAAAVSWCGLAVAGAAALLSGASPGARAHDGAEREDRPPVENVAAPRAARARAGPVSGQDLPDGVSPATVDSGRALYAGRGLCYTCHGEQGRGVAELGSSLRDRQWTHVDGSYGSLVTLIREGLTAQESSRGIPMPPRGGARLTDEQVRALAAYVWVLSRRGG